MKYADRVKQKTTTIGTEAYDINVSGDYGFSSFNDHFSEGDEVYYCASFGSQYEVGVGIITGTTLARSSLINIKKTQ
jgi:hypothetical protein